VQLVEHQGVDAVHFTGSVETGRIVGEAAGRALKPAILELGGKSPTIVFEDADIERACASALFSFTTNQGQLCTAGSRLLVQASIHDEVVSTVAAAAERLRVGDPRDPHTQLGAIVSPEQLARIERYVDQGLSSGAEIVTGGSRPEMAPPFDGGTFFSPTVFATVDRSASIAREEIFGPVLSVLPFEDEAGAVELANDVAYGLSASVWTGGVDRAVRVATSLSAGEVFVNTVLGPNEAPNEPWGMSGRGVNGPSIESARQLTRFKSVTLDATGRGPAW
jgi:acyl-CoA reductase-like NAD-dependent aldehyde dehydrogenase